LDDQQGRSLGVLVFDDCECGAKQNRALADARISSKAAATRDAGGTTGRVPELL
jgi:hypothetical protein